MAFDSIKNKVTDLLGDEEQTDAVLDKAAEFVNEKTGGQHEDKIAQAREFADGKLGVQGDGAPATS